MHRGAPRAGAAYTQANAPTQAFYSAASGIAVSRARLITANASYPPFEFPPSQQCAAISYEDPIGKPVRLTLDRLEGQVVFSLPDVPCMLGSVGGFCMTLFDESSEKRIAANSTDGNGAFTLGNLAAGDYVLIGRHASGEGGSLSLSIQLSGRPEDGGPSPGLLVRVDRHGPQ